MWHVSDLIHGVLNLKSFTKDFLHFFKEKKINPVKMAIFATQLFVKRCIFKNHTLTYSL